MGSLPSSRRDLLKGGALAVGAVATGAVGKLVTPALADNWLPHPEDATWSYSWSDSTYSSSPTTEIAGTSRPPSARPAPAECRRPDPGTAPA